MDEVILLEGNDKGATSTPSPEINKKKEVMSMHGDIKDNHELFQSFSKSTGAIKSELAIKIQELAYKIIQFEVQMDYKIAQLGLSMKENTDTMIKGFDQFSIFMN